MTVSHLKDQNLVLRAAQTNLSAEKASVVVNSAEATNEELEKLRNTVKDLENRLAESELKNQENERKINNSAQLKIQLEEKVEELERLRKDQEDLLELMADQDSKIMLFKEKLEALGVKVWIEHILRTFVYYFIEFTILTMHVSFPGWIGRKFGRSRNRRSRIFSTIKQWIYSVAVE